MYNSSLSIFGLILVFLVVLESLKPELSLPVFLLTTFWTNPIMYPPLPDFFQEYIRQGKILIPWASSLDKIISHVSWDIIRRAYIRCSQINIPHVHLLIEYFLRYTRCIYSRLNLSEKVIFSVTMTSQKDQDGCILTNCSSHCDHNMSILNQYAEQRLICHPCSRA